MNGKRIGTAHCPKCGMIDIAEVKDVTLYIGRGLSNPVASIICQKCSEQFMATVEWKSAWSFDQMGCRVIGFSRRTAEPITEDEVEDFAEAFDDHLEEFLSIVDTEES
jgi:hypothetical protein